MKDYLTTAVRALAISFTNFFRRSTTVEFPDVIRPRAERYRASFALLHEEDGDEACIGCLQCERICPSQVIAIKFGGKRESPISGKKRGYADDFVLDLNACIYCELCVQVCPTDAIVMTRESEVPAYGREDLVLTMEKLYANEKSKHRAWGDATRLNAMQVPPKPPAAAKPAAAVPPAPSSSVPPAASGAGPRAGASAAAQPSGGASAGASPAASPAGAEGTSGAKPAAGAARAGASPAASAAGTEGTSGADPAAGAARAGASPAASPAGAEGTSGAKRAAGAGGSPDAGPPGRPVDPSAGGQPRSGPPSAGTASASASSATPGDSASPGTPSSPTGEGGS